MGVYFDVSGLSALEGLSATISDVLLGSSSNYEGLENGGLPGMFWGYIWTFIGFSFIIASISEMSSMAPTSGGQYHWVSEFSSPRYQKFLSYITGIFRTPEVSNRNGQSLILPSVQGGCQFWRGKPGQLLAPI